MKRLVGLILALVICFSCAENCDALGEELFGNEETIQINFPAATIEIPRADVDDPGTTADETTNTVSGAPAGTVTTTGDYMTSPDDPEYDYFTSTILNSWRISVTTDRLQRLSRFEVADGGLTHLKSQISSTADNHLLYFPGTHAQIPAAGEQLPAAADGYRYMYIGSDHSPQFWATYLYTQAPEDGSEPEPVYVDNAGQAYWLGQSHPTGAYAVKRYSVEGLYLHGEMVEPVTKSYLAVYSSILNFVMLDAKTGKVATTYCADLTTNALPGYSYNLKTLEDANHYTPQQAAMIRAVALNGYWGIVDDPQTAAPERGSLAAMRAMMRNARKDNKAVFSEDEVNLLDEGVAAAVTQLAIWSFSNAMDDVTFVNVHYIKKNSEFSNTEKTTTLSDIPDALRPKVNLLFKLYNYMINLSPVTFNKATAENTLIHEDNFVKDISFTISGKNPVLSENQDNDSDNDTYQIDLRFSLGILAEEDQDATLAIYVLNEDGEPIASGRILGDQIGDEITLTPDGNGYYTFENLNLTEGTQYLTLTMTGTQNLDNGVYLYVSEEKDGESSQTMVGIAEGERNVDVSLKIELDFSADDEIVSVKHAWRRPVPPMEVPENGDHIGICFFLFLISGICLYSIYLKRKPIKSK